MLRLVGYKLGCVMCFDGALALLSPQRWGQFWRSMTLLLPPPLDQYATEIVEVTEKYQARSPRAMGAMFLLELAAGLLVLRLASRAR